MEILRREGGSDVLGKTRKYLCALIHKRLAVKLNWLGRGDKAGLAKYTAIVVVIKRKVFVCLR